MTQITTMQVAVVSAMAGVLLVFAAFLMMSSMASAQTPPPSPTPQQQTAPGQTPAPDGTERTRPDGAECDKDGDGQPDGQEGTGSGVRGRSAPRTFAQ